MYRPPAAAAADPNGVVDIFSQEKARFMVEPGMLPEPQQQRIHTLKGHRGAVLCLQCVESFVFSGSWDSTIRKWDLMTGECLAVMKGHVSAVLCMHAPASDTEGESHSDILCSGSSDGSMCVWSIHSGQLLRQMAGHTHWIRCLQAKGDMTLTGCADGTVRMWDNQAAMKKDELRWDIKAHEEAVLCLKMSKSGDCFVTGGKDTYVKVSSLYPLLPPVSPSVAACLAPITCSIV
jgi:WD40 repeat protein